MMCFRSKMRKLVTTRNLTFDLFKMYPVFVNFSSFQKYLLQLFSSPVLRAELLDYFMRVRELIFA